ncbi:MAG: AzlC family ABC transporter permease [Paracoccaceae bacterium]|nr:AzlC family ABC transporter permease [Paracoccaceae bacterium]MDG1736343.1 AzlC family ABC transporter permease [Paracoccaceae bacterium]MDG2258829.1 AzlC family ABC transporter permease [Paracoccaceae bacterium]
MKRGYPFFLVVLPFALLFGVVGTEAGLNLFDVLAFSVVVVAGAAQFTAVQLLSENIPTVIALLSSLAVNLRFAMYSASLTPYLGDAPLWKRAAVAYLLIDQAFAVSATEFEKQTEWTTNDRLAFFFGAVLVIVPFWFVGTLVGALVGSAIPPEFALDFALPICVLAMIGPALRTLAHIGAALTASVMSIVLVGMPHSLGILSAGILAMIVGAEIERRMKRGQA